MESSAPHIAVLLVPVLLLGFSSYTLDDNAQGFRYVAGAYYGDAGLRAALDDGSVSVRGGRDYAYTRITHAVGVAYP